MPVLRQAQGFVDLLLLLPFIGFTLWLLLGSKKT
jgi:hypothetical protein